MKREETTLPNIEFTTATGNYDESRLPIDTIVIHSTVGTVQSAINRFGTKGTKVSAHYIIGNDGKLYQGLEEYYTAYHSGNYNINQRSIGIEHEWYQGIHPSDALYETSAKLVADICRFYNIPCDRQHIKKHSEIIPTACPNEIDVERIVRQARQILGSGLTSGDYYLGIDLNNKESVKVCVQTWKDVVDGKFIKKEEYEKVVAERDELKKKQLSAEALLYEKNTLAVKLQECEKQRDIYKAEYDNATKEGGYIEQIKYLEEAKKKQSDEISELTRQVNYWQTKYNSIKKSGLKFIQHAVILLCEKAGIDLSKI
jgi:hypothetical protein